MVAAEEVDLYAPLIQIEAARCVFLRLMHCSSCPEQSHVGCRHAGDWVRVLRHLHRLCLRLRSALRGSAMLFDYVLSGLVTAGLLVYLIYALLKPELF
jgi:K+-transporting ATPase KdpF subunit